jgi:hypothetical protein
MSARITLYGTWAKMTNDGGIAGRTLFGAPALGANPGNVLSPGFDPSSVQIGLSHNF